MTRPNDKDREQSERFQEAARELGCDKSEERFDAALRTIAKQKPSTPSPVKDESKQDGDGDT